MDIRQTIAHLAQDKDEQMLLIRAAERLTAAQQRNIPTATAFLAAREQTLLAQLFPHDPPVFFGGCDGAERRVAAYLPDYLEESWLLGDDSPVAAVRAVYFEEDTLTHRDFLGALMGAGIKRETVGDIYVTPGRCDFVVLRELRDFFLQNLPSAGRTKLTLAPLELAELSAPAAAVKTRHDTVSSLRFDSVLASAFSLARGKAAALIESGRAELDHALCQKPDKPVSEGSILSVRGLGRARLDSVDGTTKKGRIGITVSRFI